MNTVFVFCALFATVVCVNASCYLDLSSGAWCRQTRKLGFKYETDFYSVGQKWMNGPCEECMCSAATYQIHLNCSLPLEDGMIESTDVPQYFVNLGNVLPRSCPFGFDQVTEENANVTAQMFVVYRTVETAEKSCCTSMQPSKIPDECEAVREPDSCTYKYVLKENNDIECPGPISMKG